MKDKSSAGKISFIQCHSVNVKGNQAHLAEKNSQPGVIESNIIYNMQKTELKTKYKSKCSI